jgi:hypothetical protein
MDLSEFGEKELLGANFVPTKINFVPPAAFQYHHELKEIMFVRERHYGLPSAL